MFWYRINPFAHCSVQLLDDLLSPLRSGDACRSHFRFIDRILFIELNPCDVNQGRTTYNCPQRKGGHLC